MRAIYTARSSLDYRPRMEYKRGMTETTKPAPKPQRTRHLRTRLTPEQYARIAACANRAGITISAWVAERLLVAVTKEEASCAR